MFFYTKLCFIDISIRTSVKHEMVGS